MKLLNQTKNTVVSADLKIAKNFLEQSLGLYKYKQPTALMLKTRYGIHTLLMQYTIDVIILNKEHHVVAFKESLKPNHYFVWNPHYDIVLELPEGALKQSKTHLDDQLQLI